MGTFLVVQTSFIGDVILTTPMIAAAARSGPVIVVTTPAGASVLANNPAIHTLIVYDKRGQDRGIRGFIRTVQRIRAARRAAGPIEHNFSWAHLCQGSVRSGLLALLSGFKRRAGFNTSAGAWTYTTKVEYRDDWHHTQRLLSLLRLDAAEIMSARNDPRVYPDDADVTAVDGMLRDRARPLIAIAPGSVWATKRWPYYAELCERLVQTYDVAVIGAAGDAEVLGALVTDSRVIDATGKLSLLGSAALIGRALAIVTNDSSPQHLASAVGTPTVTVFGPTVPDFGFGPLAPRSQVVGRTDLACRPCDRHGPQRCPLGHWRCMRDVDAATVHATVNTVIHQHSSR